MPKPTASSKSSKPKLIDIFYQCAENMVADLHAEVMKMFDDQDNELCKEYGIDQTYAQQDSTSFDQDMAVLEPKYIEMMGGMVADPIAYQEAVIGAIMQPFEDKLAKIQKSQPKKAPETAAMIAANN